MSEQGNATSWKIGLLFVVGLALLLVLTFGTQQINLLSGNTKLTVYFTSAQGIQAGSNVRVMGVKKGIVKSTSIVSSEELPEDRTNYRVRLTLQLNEQPSELKKMLSGTYRFLVRSSSVLGGSEISIERADPSHPEAATINFDGPNYGSAQIQGLQALSEWFSENRSSLTSTIDSIQSASKSIQDISARVEQGEGTLGKLIGDDKLYDQITSIADNTEKITSSIEQGDGVLGRLVRDDEMGENLEATLSDLREAASSFRDTARKINQGEGTISQLINDEDMANKLESTLDEINTASTNLRKISSRIQDGKGTIGRLVQDEEMGKNLESILRDLKEASRSIRSTSQKIDQGEGTLGKLVNDEKLYNDAKTTVEGLSDITGSARKIRTFVGLKTRYYADTEHSIHKAYLRVHPDQNKFLQVGASAFDLDYPDTRFSFEEGVEDQSDQLLTTSDVQLGYRFYDGHLTFRGGLIEGRLGAGADYDLDVPFLNRSVKLTVEGRGAYEDVEDDDLDEQIDSDILWRSGVQTSFLDYGRIEGGVSRIGADEELYVGVGFEYEDQDIRNFFSLLGLAN